ncbi:MAG: hypothetical protein DKM22_03210 [Candidatus Melainabacteria bacterium]|nr:MAG: hypothetical protein DKM22_03210 [Candidatus Melainabacteria bacterium]
MPCFFRGIDSTLLLYLCKETNVIAITFSSNFQTKEEIELTKELCKQYCVKQFVVEKNIFDNPIILNNPKDRCYHCKN